MMWAAFISISLCVLGMGLIYFILDSRKHTRREKLLEKVEKLEDELQIAMVEVPEDIALHAALHTRIKRLRDKADSL